MKNYEVKAIDIKTKEVVTTTYVNCEKEFIYKEVVGINDAVFNIQCAEIENLLKSGVVNKLLVLRELEFMKTRSFYGKLHAFIIIYAICEWLDNNISFKEALAEAFSCIMEGYIGYWDNTSWDDLNLATRFIKEVVSDCLNNAYRTIIKIIAQKGKLRKYMLPNSDNISAIWKDIKPNLKIFCSDWRNMRLIPYLGEIEIGEQDTDFCFSDFRKELDYNEEYIEL